jgi:multiple sugar transport system substrate-binding protein
MVAVDKSVDPASGNWTINERLAALLQGKTAMAFNWVALFGGIADDPASTPFAGKFGYAVVPKGPKGQGAAYGCQGTGINSFSTQKEIAWQYIQWLTSRETQLAMVERPEACFISGRKDLVEAAQYPWQQALLDLIPYVRDIWNIPEYASLLNVLQTELNLAYVGRKPADEALNDAALAHQAIYDTIVEQGGAEGQG